MAKKQRPYPHVINIFAAASRMTKAGTPSKTRLPLILMRDTPHRLSVVCFGSPRHRRKDGRMCWHVEMLLNQLKPWYRQRTYVRLPHEAGDRDGVKAVA